MLYGLTEKILQYLGPLLKRHGYERKSSFLLARRLRNVRK